MTFEQEKAVLEAVGCLHAFKNMLLEACNRAPGDDAENLTQADTDAFFARNLALMNDIYAQATDATLQLGEALSRANPSKPKTN